MIYGAATLIPRAIGFALLPVYAHNMTPADYGLLATIDVFTMYLSITVNAGFSSALLRFYYDREDEKWRLTVFSTCLAAAAGLGLLGLVLVQGGLEIGVSQFSLSPVLRQFLGLAAATVFFEVVNGVVWTLYRLEKRAPRALLVAGVRALIAVPLNIYLIAVLKLAVLGFLLSNLAVAIAVVVLLSMPEIVKHRARPDVKLLRGLLSFSLPYIPIGFIEAFVNNMGVICLSLVGGLSSVGLFAIGTKMAAIITLAYAPINTVWMPMMYERTNTADGQKFYTESTTYILIFLSFAVVGVVSLGGPLLTAMTPDEYAAASSVVIPLAIGAGIYSLRTNVRVGFTLARQTKLLPLYTIVPIIAGFPLTLLLSWLSGIMGTAFGVAATMIMTIFLTGWRSRKYFAASYEWGKIARLALAVAICVTLATITPGTMLFVRGGIVVLFTGMILSLRIIHWRDLERLLPSFIFNRNRGSRPNAFSD